MDNEVEREKWLNQKFAVLDRIRSISRDCRVLEMEPIPYPGHRIVPYESITGTLYTKSAIISMFLKCNIYYILYNIT